MGPLPDREEHPQQQEQRDHQQPCQRVGDGVLNFLGRLLHHLSEHRRSDEHPEDAVGADEFEQTEHEQPDRDGDDEQAALVDVAAAPAGDIGLPEQPTGQRRQRRGAEHLPQHHIDQPLCPRLAGGCHRQQQQRQHHEQEAEAVVDATLTGQVEANPFRHILFGVGAGDNRRGGDRVGRGQHGADQQRQGQRQPHREQQTGSRQPHHRHAGTDDPGDPPPVPSPVSVRQA